MKRNLENHNLKVLKDLNISGIVGIDPSLTGTGFCRLSGSVRHPRVDCERHGDTDPKNHLTLRLNDLTSLLVKKVQYRDIVFIEDYAYSRQSASMTKLVGFGELLKWRIWRRTKRLPITIPISTLKQWYTGKGRIKKDQVLVKAARLYGIEFATTDEAEAYALCDLGAEAVCKTEDLGKFPQAKQAALLMARKKIKDVEKFCRLFDV